MMESGKNFAKGTRLLFDAMSAISKCCAPSKKGGLSQEKAAGALVADEVDGAAHVDVDKVDVDRLVQQLRAPRHRVRIPAADLSGIRSFGQIDR